MEIESQIATGTLLLLALVGLPILALAYAGHADQTKDRKPTLKETYPDDHFFI